MNSSTCACGSTTPLAFISAVRTNRMLFSIIESALVPGFALGCACGCGVFDVGTAAMILTHPGAMLYLEDDYQDQNRIGWARRGPLRRTIPTRKLRRISAEWGSTTTSTATGACR